MIHTTDLFIQPFFKSDILHEMLNQMPEPKRLGVGFPIVDGFREKSGAGILEYALAGFSKEQLKIELQNGEVVVSANVDNPTEGKRRIVRKSFEHKVRVAEDLDPSKLIASYKDGILRIEIPQRIEAKPRAFPISAEE